MKTMSKRARIILATLICLAVAVAAYAAVAYAPAADERDEGTGNTSAQTDSDTFRGKLGCLPHKGDGPHTMECAYGLQAEDGDYYALKQGDGAQNVTEVAQELQGDVVVTGSLGSAGDSKYDIVGTITYTKIIAD